MSELKHAVSCDLCGQPLPPPLGADWTAPLDAVGIHGDTKLCIGCGQALQPVPPPSDTPITDYLLGRQWSGTGPISGLPACPECRQLKPSFPRDPMDGHLRTCPLARALAAVGEMVEWKRT